MLFLVRAEFCDNGTLLKGEELDVVVEQQQRVVKLLFGHVGIVQAIRFLTGSGSENIVAL